MDEGYTMSIDNIGYKGSTLITDTASHAGLWQKIVPLEATAFTTLTDLALNQVASEGGNVVGAQSFPATVVLTGRFTVIKLASGAVMAYK